jgi:putative endonuclease
MKYSKTRQFGNIGEEIASKILISNGYLVIERNFLRRVGEIDIIAHKENTIHFFEVKTHTISQYDVSCETELPEHNMSSKKLKRLARAVDLYLMEKNIFDNYFECHGISLFLDESHNLIQYYITKNINIV